MSHRWVRSAGIDDCLHRSGRHGSNDYCAHAAISAKRSDFVAWFNSAASGVALDFLAPPDLLAVYRDQAQPAPTPEVE